MSDWQVGDLAVCDDSLPECAACAADDDARRGPWLDYLNEAQTVVYVSPPDPFSGETECGISLAPDPVGEKPWCSCQFRKIRPDEHEACEEEFCTLLRRSRQTVRA